MTPSRLLCCGCLLVLVLRTAGPARSEPPRLADALERRDRAAAVALLESAGSGTADVSHIVRATQVDGMTALHWAVFHDDADLVRRLLQHGADAGAPNRYGVTPLSLACTNGNADIVRQLLQAGADARSTLLGGETVLMTAARTGRPEPVAALIAQGADVNAREERGQTALMWAAADGHAEVVRQLIDAGADVRMTVPSGFHALAFAARNGHAEVARVLLASGADVNEPLSPERDMKFRKAAGRGTSPLILAVENGHFELAVLLLELGADPNDSRSGFTPLHVLSWVRKPNLGDGDDGDPPPFGSGTLGSLDFVDRLVAHGADVNARAERGKSGRGRLDETGATPFLFAARTADVPLMQRLVAHGADPLLPAADDTTPLMAAAGLGTVAPGEEAGTEPEVLEAVRLIVALGADLNAVNDDGDTAMHGAAYKNLPQVVRLLDELGADIAVWNRRNEHGWTPLRIAEGYRFGNFKPSPETVSALHEVMRAHGVEPPRGTDQDAGGKQIYR